MTNQAGHCYVYVKDDKVLMTFTYADGDEPILTYTMNADVTRGVIDTLQRAVATVEGTAYDQDALAGLEELLEQMPDTEEE